MTKKLNEKDYSYKARIGHKYLKGKSFTSNAENADVFESETEPRQRINQLKKSKKFLPKGKITLEKIRESKVKTGEGITTFDTINFVKRFCEYYGFIENEDPRTPPAIMSYKVKDNIIEISVQGKYYDDIIVEGFHSTVSLMNHYGIVTGDDQFYGSSKEELEEDLKQVFTLNGIF